MCPLLTRNWLKPLHPAMFASPCCPRAEPTRRVAGSYRDRALSVAWSSIVGSEQDAMQNLHLDSNGRQKFAVDWMRAAICCQVGNLPGHQLHMDVMASTSAMGKISPAIRDSHWIGRFRFYIRRFLCSYRFHKRVHDARVFVHFLSPISSCVDSNAEWRTHIVKMILNYLVFIKK